MIVGPEKCTKKHRWQMPAAFIPHSGAVPRTAPYLSGDHPGLLREGARGGLRRRRGALPVDRPGVLLVVGGPAGGGSAGTVWWPNIRFAAPLWFPFMEYMAALDSYRIKGCHIIERQPGCHGPNVSRWTSAPPLALPSLPFRGSSAAGTRRWWRWPTPHHAEGHNSFQSTNELC